MVPAFDLYLERRGLKLEATVIGGAALQLLGLIERPSETRIGRFRSEKSVESRLAQQRPSQPHVETPARLAQRDSGAVRRTSDSLYNTE